MSAPVTYQLRRGAGRAAAELTLQMAVATASRVALLKDRIAVLEGDAIPDAVHYGDPAHVIDSLWGELTTARAELELYDYERVLGGRDELGALWMAA